MEGSDMSSKPRQYPAINPSFPNMLHGGDYNPDQWIRTPEIWDEDMRLMNLAHCNTMSVGIFSWAMLEPEEGCYEFGWLDTIMDKLAAEGARAVLATPSGAWPAWLSKKYPEVMRIESNRHRNLHGGRHNHCFTSPVYREKTQKINRLLAERYKDHPALLVWHISNEYGGECHCDLCQNAFRDWLRKRYNHDIDALNLAWWTGFWSHRFNSFDQIESPAPHGEHSVHGHNLDWRRFVTAQTTDFMKQEMIPLRELTPNIPITTNMMGTYPGLDYWKMAPELDVISWDNYPSWHRDDRKTWQLASDIAFVHDINRCLKGGKPFMLMESTPSHVNWQPVNKLKRPGMHRLSSLQAVAHGADTVQYFQWRKSRGASEKFHGAVVDHVGHEHTRVFRDVTEVGLDLEKLSPVIGTTVRPDAAVIYDWENRWAIDDAQALRNGRGEKKYEEVCKQHYQAFWEQGIPVDVIDSECDFSGYKLVVAPMLYMLKPGVAERLTAFVEAGGTLVTTFFTGYVDQSDLCFLGGFPGPLKKVTGIWSEEIDSLYDTDTNGVRFSVDNELGLAGAWMAHTYCEIIHAEGARVAASYTTDFYADQPVLTVNDYGKGQAWHLAAMTEYGFLQAFYGKLAEKLTLLHSLDTELPEGVSAQLRTDGSTRFVFLMNYSEEEKTVAIPEKATDLLTGTECFGTVGLEPYGVVVLKI